MKDFGEVLHEEFNKIEEYYVPDDKEHIIWDSEINIADEIDKEEIRDNEYQDYLDTLEDGEEPQSLDDFCDELIENGFFDNYEDANLDDLEENILPEIDKQLNENYLMLCGGYNSNYPDFRPSGKGGTDFEGADGFRDYISNFDRVAITSTDGVLGAICGDHDGVVAGQFYTLPDDPKELIKALGLEEKVKEDYADADWEDDTVGEYDSMGNYRHYDLEDLVEKEYNELITYGGLDVADFQQHLDLMKPIKDTISMYGQKTESKLQETRIPAQKLIDKYKDADKVTVKEITDDLNSASPEASDETINGLLAQVKDGLKELGFKVGETELVKESKEIITESDDGPVYYNILHGEDNKYTLLVKTSKRIKGKESDRDDTVLMKLINALEEKELIDPDLAEDLEFGDLRIEWPSTVKFLLDRGFTCYDLTKYKFKENKEVKTEGILNNITQEDEIDEWKVFDADIDIDTEAGKQLVDTFKDYEQNIDEVITNIRIDYNTENGSYIVSYIDNSGRFHNIDYKLSNDELAKLVENKEIKTEIASRASKDMIDIMNKFIKKNKLDPDKYKVGTFRIRMKDVPPQEVAGIITNYNGMDYGFRYLPLPGSWTITLIQTGASVSEKPYDELTDAINDLPNIDKKIDDYVQTNGDKIDQMTDKFNYITKAIDDVYKAGSVPSLIKAVKNIKGLPENAVKDIIDRINNNLQGDFTVSDYEDVQDMVVSKLQKIKEFNESKELKTESKKYIIQGNTDKCISYNDADDLMFIADTMVEAIADYVGANIDVVEMLENDGVEVSTERNGKAYTIVCSRWNLDGNLESEERYYIPYKDEDDLKFLIDTLIDIFLQFAEDDEEVLDILGSNYNIEEVE